MAQAKFTIGQIIHHKLFDYRGVIVDVDFQFSGTAEWYNQVARSRPSKHQPWYRVLVDEENYETYVAEQNLEPSQLIDPIRHGQLSDFFVEYRNGVYRSRARSH